MMSKAIISRCGKYRYTLERAWSRDPRYLMFVMLNPSTADAKKDDNTIRRCVGFAKLLGFDGILVGNLYAYRTPHPKVLKQAAKTEAVIGPDNNRHLKNLMKRASMVICAWGQPGPIKERAAEVHMMNAAPVYALAYTKHGLPRHPLMLPKTARPTIYI
jgi:hypothetical protein